MDSTTSLPSLPLPPDVPFAFSLQALADHLASVPDRRHARGKRYPLAPMLSLALIAKLAGHSRLKALAHWAQLRAADLASLFGLSRSSMPHPSTWSRILGHALDPCDLEKALSSFFQSHAQPAARGSIVLAIDGKTITGTIPLGRTRGVHLVAAYLPEQGVVLAQLAVESKENEIVVMPSLLASLDLQGRVVVGDAMQTQRELSVQVLEGGGDYVWFVKENQPTLLAEIEELFMPPPITPGHSAPARDFVQASKPEKGHGRREERRITVSSMLAGYSDWPGLEQVFKLERRVWQEGKAEMYEVRYGITSLPRSVASARRLLGIARAEWGIENGLHYRRDVTLEEDEGQVRRGGAPQVMAALNNVVVSLLGQAGEKNLPDLQRSFDYHFDRFLTRWSLDTTC
jgi:predicted transposase YbfD/YdcC